MLLICISVFLIYVAHERGREKGFKEARKRINRSIADRIKSFSYWMVEYPMVHNALYLLGDRMLKHENFEAMSLKDNIEILGKTKIGDLNKEQIKEILG